MEVIKENKSLKTRIEFCLGVLLVITIFTAYIIPFLILQSTSIGEEMQIQILGPGKFKDSRGELVKGEEDSSSSFISLKEDLEEIKILLNLNQGFGLSVQDGQFQFIAFGDW